MTLIKKRDVRKHRSARGRNGMHASKPVVVEVSAAVVETESFIEDFKLEHCSSSPSSASAAKDKALASSRIGKSGLAAL